MSVNFENVNVGDTLPKWSRKTSFAEWNRYAAVNEEFVPFHMDDEAGRRAGNEQGAFGMGNLRYAYIVNALHAWIGDTGVVREVGCQYRAINQKDDVLTVIGEVTDKRTEDGEQRVYLDINVVNQDGGATCPGHAVVALP
ncbi:MAG: MaoC/PaaZ C-terminal domain-containing protein [Gammaproteobacteria bacterium]|nr:MaoC/PaaZ C-terminal domain-containing protein [Gammaproteobacteria bacterium]